MNDKQRLNELKFKLMGLDTLWIIHKSLWAAPWANTMNQAHQGKAKVLGTVLLGRAPNFQGLVLGLGDSNKFQENYGS